MVSNSGSSYNSYASSDIVTYKEVTEYNDLGKTINIFTQNNTNDQLYSFIHSKYNKWKDGLLEKSIILNNVNDTVKVQTHKFAFNPLKNSLSGYVSRYPEEIAFAHDIEITQYLSQLHGGTSPEYIDVYYVDKKYIPIESGKIEATETIITDFFQNKKNGI
ncbi:hypothetical protein HX13_20725 [Chryseobacterium sp. P1-3]|nr:hypothetical protein HX13_20725 [Chryseobacterium sp. P1-3]